MPDDPTAGIKSELGKVREEIKSRRKAIRSSRADVSDLQQRAKELKIALEAARQAAREARKQVAEANRQHLQAIEAQRRAAVLQAQKASGLYWANSGDVLESYEVARKRAARDNTELRFHRWDGTGKVFVRYQYGLHVADVFGGDTRLQIDPVPEEAWSHPKRSVRRKLARTRVRLRVTSENRSPVWCRTADGDAPAFTPRR